MKSKKKAILDKSRCDHSPFCPAKKACHAGAITQKTIWFFRAEIPEIDHVKCIGCGRCVEFCAHKAIKMK